jgi:hypothetical protein
VYLDFMKTLSSARDIIDRLGGIYAVAELTDAQPKAVWNWQRFDTFPANTFVVMTRALGRRRCKAPATFWRMKGQRAA